MKGGAWVSRRRDHSDRTLLLKKNYLKISNSAKSALIDIAKESPLNKARVSK